MATVAVAVLLAAVPWCASSDVPFKCLACGERGVTKGTVPESGRSCEDWLDDIATNIDEDGCESTIAEFTKDCECVEQKWECFPCNLKDAVDSVAADGETVCQSLLDNIRAGIGETDCDVATDRFFKEQKCACKEGVNKCFPCGEGGLAQGLVDLPNVPATPCQVALDDIAANEPEAQCKAETQTFRDAGCKCVDPSKCFPCGIGGTAAGTVNGDGEETCQSRLEGIILDTDKSACEETTASFKEEGCQCEPCLLCGSEDMELDMESGSDNLDVCKDFLSKANESLAGDACMGLKASFEAAGCKCRATAPTETTPSAGNSLTPEGCKTESPEFCLEAECEGGTCRDALADALDQMRPSGSQNPNAVPARNVCAIGVASVVAKCPACAKCDEASRLFLVDGPRAAGAEADSLHWAPATLALVAVAAAGFAAAASTRRRRTPLAQDEVSLIGSDGTAMAPAE